MRPWILTLVAALVLSLGAPDARAEDGARFYVVENGAQAGPYTLAELEGRARAGQLTGQTLIWATGMAQWTPAAQVPELAQVLGQGGVVPDAPTDFKAFLTGAWVADPTQVPVSGVGLGTANAVTTFHEAGAFELKGSIQGVHASGMDFTITLAATGTFKVQSLGAKSFRVVYEGDLMSTWQHPDPNVPGVPNITKLQPATYEVLDANTLRDGEGYVMRRRQ